MNTRLDAERWPKLSVVRMQRRIGGARRENPQDLVNVDMGKRKQGGILSF